MRIKIANSGEDKDYTVSISPQASVGALKARVSSTIDAKGKFLRLIAAGRMLTPDTQPLEKFKLRDGGVVHVLVSDRAPRMQANPEMVRVRCVCVCVCGQHCHVSLSLCRVTDQHIGRGNAFTHDCSRNGDHDPRDRMLRGSGSTDW